jgi:integrase
LISLALATGLRAIELISLDVGDLRHERHDGAEEWWLVLPDEKTKGQHGGRTLPLAPTLMETLLAYIRATGRRMEDARDRATPLFLSAHGRTRTGADREGGPSHEPLRNRRLSASHVRLIVDRVETQWRAANAIGNVGELTMAEGRAISPHALRHSTAVALLQGNETVGRPPASVEHVRGWLGHFDIRTTQGYLAHLDARRHRRPFALTPGTAPETERAPRDETAPQTDE